MRKVRLSGGMRIGVLFACIQTVVGQTRDSAAISHGTRLLSPPPHWQASNNERHSDKRCSKFATHLFCLQLQLQKSIRYFKTDPIGRTFDNSGARAICLLLLIIRVKMIKHHQLFLVDVSLMGSTNSRLDTLQLTTSVQIDLRTNLPATLLLSFSISPMVRTI